LLNSTQKEKELGAYYRNVEFLKAEVVTEEWMEKSIRGWLDEQGWWNNIRFSKNSKNTTFIYSNI
jgi:kynureninase